MKSSYICGGKFAITPRDQQFPAQGDLVEVDVYMFLPTDKETGIEYLPLELHFGRRVFLADAPLDRFWGSLFYSADKEPMRKAGFTVTAPTWAEAMSKARAQAHAQFQALDAAMLERRKALTAAGPRPAGEEGTGEIHLACSRCGRDLREAGIYATYENIVAHEGEIILDDDGRPVSLLLSADELIEQAELVEVCCAACEQVLPSCIWEGVEVQWK